jgi:glycosyltransferase involved in cell wall biosynthesis
MRILVVSDLWCPFPGGAEVYLRNTVLELIKRGHEIEVLTSYAPAQHEDKFKVSYISIPVYAEHQKGWSIIWDVVQKFRPQVVLTHHFFAGEFPEIFSSLGLPTIEIVHSRQRSRATLAVFNSEYTAHTPGQLKLPRDMVILPMANPEYKVTTGDVPFDRQYLGQIKAVGGKGIMMTYALAKRFPQRKFLVLRGEWQGAETMISNTPNVEYMEPVKDIREFYSRCRMLLMPSEREEAGTVPFEATLNGLPCISSDVMGLPETNRGGIILPISTRPWDNEMPCHPDNESITRWQEEINRLDNPVYYNDVVARQQTFMSSVPWPGLFDELSGKIEQIVQEHRPN